MGRRCEELLLRDVLDAKEMPEIFKVRSEVHDGSCRGLRFCSELRKAQDRGSLLIAWDWFRKLQGDSGKQCTPETRTCWRLVFGRGRRSYSLTSTRGRCLPWDAVGTSRLLVGRCSCQMDLLMSGRGSRVQVAIACVARVATMRTDADEGRQRRRERRLRRSSLSPSD